MKALYKIVDDFAHATPYLFMLICVSLSIYVLLMFLWIKFVVKPDIKEQKRKADESYWRNRNPAHK